MNSDKTLISTDTNSSTPENSPLKTSGETERTVPSAYTGNRAPRFHNDVVSVGWIKDVHKAPTATRSYVIYGNDDAPERIECYLQSEPTIKDLPLVVILPYEPEPLTRTYGGFPAVIHTSVTKAIAVDSRHGRIFYHRTERNKDGTAVRCRVTGKCKVWKTRPHDYRLPVKYGMKQSFYLTHRNSDVWLLSDPTMVQGELPVERRKIQTQGFGYYGLDRRSAK